MGQPYSHRSYARITCPLRTTTIFETSFFRRWLMLQIHSDGTVKLMHGVLQRYRSVGAARPWLRCHHDTPNIRANAGASSAGSQKASTWAERAPRAIRPRIAEPAWLQNRQLEAHWDNHLKPATPSVADRRHGLLARHRRADGLCQNLGENTDELLQGLGSNAVVIERLRSLKAVA